MDVNDPAQGRELIVWIIVVGLPIALLLAMAQISGIRRRSGRR